MASALAGRLQSVREEECTRIAREINDEFVQVLIVIKMDLTRLADKFDGVPEADRHESRFDFRLIGETTSSILRIPVKLRPWVLDDADLPAVVERKAKDFRIRFDPASYTLNARRAWQRFCVRVNGMLDRTRRNPNENPDRG